MTPAAALLDHAAHIPEDPWLFRRAGWDWHWISFRAAADAVRAALPGTRGGGGGQGGSLSFETILQDLAVQAAGRTVVVRSHAGERIELTAADLAAAAEAIARAIIGEASCFSPLSRGSEGGAGRGAGGEGRPRDILVLGGSLDDPATRALLSWATVAGAALLLEPDPVNVVGTAVWARPTVFAGTVEETSRLRLAAERQNRGRLRRLFRRRVGLPFGRLHTLLVTDPGPLPPEDEAFWRQRGVAIRFLPQCGIAWYISRRGDRDA